MHYRLLQRYLGCEVVIYEMNCVLILLPFLWNPTAIFAELSEFYYPYIHEPLELEDFIAGGVESFTGEFPHMAAIGYEGDDNNTIEWFCGGSLITNKYVLTAAHCVVNRRGSPTQVRLGDLDLSTEEDYARPQDFKVLRSIPHPSYKPPSRYHDIALLELDREVILGDYVSTACLNTEREIDESQLIATGWGQMGHTDPSSKHLLKVTLDLVSNDACAKAYQNKSAHMLPDGVVDDFQICAGKVKGQDTCQGDSGGPLQALRYDGVSIIYGVTSFGRVCALRNPGVYTRISHYIPWIRKIAYNAYLC